jgi:acetylornithine deacetylase/succinyl-diaminopimelate desuccinylase-like protein
MSAEIKQDQYISQHKDRFLEELIEFLRIPSVSAQPAHKQDVLRAAEFVKNQLLNAGADKAEVMTTSGHPIVYAERMVDDSLPTVLVYGHYDVQPSDPDELWHSPAFEPVIKDDKIYARGSADDKGQMYMHIKALEAMEKTGGSPCNLKFIFEGEEEVGSVELAPFLKTYREMLKADVVLVSDTAMISNEDPSITVGLRGLSYVEVEVTGPNRDLHSGIYGGAVANPINILSRMIAGLHDEQNRITVKGFYDDVIEVSSEERHAMNQAPFNLGEYKTDLGIAEVWGEEGYTTLERASIRPTLDVNGIWGGYTGDGAKTVLPSKAYAKISMRLVPGQDPAKITALFTEHFLAVAPDCVSVKVTPHHGGDPAVTSLDSAGYRAAAKAMEDTFGKAPIPVRGGGSIPIVALFKEVLGLDTILMGFGLDSNHIHSPNENYGIFNYFKGIETFPRFHRYFTELSR